MRSRTRAAHFRPDCHLAAGHYRVLQCFPEQSVDKSIMLTPRAITRIPDQFVNQRQSPQAFLDLYYRDTRDLAQSDRIEFKPLQAGYSKKVLVIRIELPQGIEQ